MTKRATHVPEMEHSYFKFETKSGHEYAKHLHEFLVLAEVQADESKGDGDCDGEA